MTNWFYYLGKIITGFIFRIWFHIEFHGQENQPQDRGYILCCNHRSALDPVLIGVLGAAGAAAATSSPQIGQAEALSDTRLPHFLHLISAISRYLKVSVANITFFLSNLL